MWSSMSSVLACGLVAHTYGARVQRKRTGASSGNFSVNWEQFDGPGPLGRIPAAATTCDGQLFVFGGETDYRPDPWTVNRYLDDLWVFTPASGGDSPSAKGAWTELAPRGGARPSSRVSGSMVCAAGKLTLYGGIHKTEDGEFITVGDVWSFDISSQAWTLVMENSASAGGPGELTAHTAVLTDLDQDTMVVYGGHGQSSQSSSSDVWRYSLSRQTWTRGRPPFSPGARHFHTAVAVPGTSNFRVWGGSQGSRDTTVWEYDVAGDRWTHSGFGPEYASGRMGAHWEGRLWSFGGMQLKSLRPMYMNELTYQNEYNNAFDVSVPTRGKAPEGRCYAAVTALDGALWVFGGYRRPADEERLSTLWKATLA